MFAIRKNIVVSIVSALVVLGAGTVQAGPTPSATSADSSTVNEMLKTAGAEHLNVYKSPTCGCCIDWAEHAEENGFGIKNFHPQNLTQMKLDLGIQGRFHSCHTAVSESGYLFEGHVPARLVKQFLADPPEGALGLTVPGMPMGSPGMEMGERFQPYQVLLMKKGGDYEIYATIDQQAEQY
ncbi:DUF411 domain-containing protein [Marinobacterium marinum]|nr:DUF411 domain-containing protein [Marinobacterium marinum]